MQSKGDDVMPFPTSFDRVCYPKAVMLFHAQRRSTVCAVQRQGWHATPDVVRLCVLSKSNDVMPRPTLPTVCVVQGRLCNATADVVLLCVKSKGDDVKPRLTSFDIVCHLRAMMKCHARRLATVCAAQR